MAGPEDFLPPSFWAASISCLFLSSSSICFCFLLLLLLPLDLLLLCPLLCCLLLLLLGADLLPGGLFVLQPLQLSLLLGAFIPPLGDVLPELIVHLRLLLEI